MADTALYTDAIAIYDFENNPNDTKGAKDLTAVSSPAYSTTGEAQGTYWAGELDGSADRFSRTDASFRFAGDYSISAWVRFKYVVEGYYTPIASCYDTVEGDGWCVKTDGSRHLQVSHITASSVTSANFSGAVLSNDTRYHVVVSYDDSANTVTAWVSTTSFGNIINGTTVAMAANPGVDSGILYIGYEPSADDNLYGYVDEVVFWTRPIDATESAAIFAARDGGASWREEAAGGVTASVSETLNFAEALD